jgi:phosphoserine phosphatase
VSIRVVFFDCDGTLTRVRSSWEYLHRRLGLWEKKADRYQELFRSGAIDYERFCELDSLLWKGTALSAAEEVAAEIPYQAGACACVEGLRARGIYTVIVSTGLSLIVDRAQRELAVDRAFSNGLVARAGFLTGEFDLAVHFDAKGRIVADLLASLGLSRKEAAAVGDGEGDRGMFEAVGTAIGFHPQETLLPILSHTLQDHSLLPLLSIVDAYG